jgi:hypothetical protein
MRDSIADQTREAVVLFDTQCPYNLISTGYLKRAFGIDYEGMPAQPLGFSLTGTAYESVGQKVIHWWSPNVALYIYEESECYVVSSELFEVLIGYETIDKLRLFVPRHKLIAAWTTQRPGLKGMPSITINLTFIHH